ncbi:DsbA family protein [Pseudomonas sp. CCI4.2]|uniref:DsbA family oxidoreductase n=1 Tax=Pseudomonas sp. CCI4.2 TaxID=3048620 RepID=UPI002AC99915|nr:DsbA family protein [Pseudomonas sp. CCI4.2]MEB0091744.1 DsbA family protein [Pseudomonas sp. CCI4.2]WPX56258.1 DsbA family protein [Pseudomonas sp. CCI4.2]
MNSDGPLKVDIWSDYVCPFCYLQLAIIDQLQQEYGSRITVQWHAFELRPEPLATLDPSADYLRATWRQAIYPMAQKRKVLMKLPPVQPRSRNVLEAAAFAKVHGKFEAFHKEAFRAFFEFGRDIGDILVLLEVGSRAGLDRQALNSALSNHHYTDQIVADEGLADELGLRAVPAFLIRRADQPLSEATVMNGTMGIGPFKREIDRLCA